MLSMDVSTQRERRTRRRGGLAQFVLGRLAQSALVLLASSCLIFLATNALPGNVAETILGRNATPETVDALTERLNLDRPVLQQYGSWLLGLLHGDLGDSGIALAQNAKTTAVSALIAEPLTNSVILACLAFIVLVPVSLVLGLVAGAGHGRSRDFAISYSALLLGSFPEFVLGSILISIFFTKLDLLPPVALVAPGASPFAHPDALILPILTLVGVSVGFASRQIRSGVVEVMNREYVAMAQLNGLPPNRILSRYVLRNALVPAVQAFAQTAQYLVGGILVVEAVFGYPGIGTFLVRAAEARDLTAVAGVAVLLAAAYVAINIVADLLVVLLVPKLRTGAAR